MRSGPSRSLLLLLRRGPMGVYYPPSFLLPTIDLGGVPVRCRRAVPSQEFVRQDRQVAGRLDLRVQNLIAIEQGRAAILLVEFLQRRQSFQALLYNGVDVSDLGV